MKTPTKKEMKEMLQTIDTKGYLYVCGELVYKKGKSGETDVLFIVSRGDYQNGFSEIRGLFCELELLINLGMTNTNKFYNAETGLVAD